MEQWLKTNSTFNVCGLLNNEVVYLIIKHEWSCLELQIHSAAPESPMSSSGCEENIIWTWSEYYWCVFCIWLWEAELEMFLVVFNGEWSSCSKCIDGRLGEGDFPRRQASPAHPCCSWKVPGQQEALMEWAFVGEHCCKCWIPWGICWMVRRSELTGRLRVKIVLQTYFRTGVFCSQGGMS